MQLNTLDLNVRAEQERKKLESLLTNIEEGSHRN